VEVGWGREVGISLLGDEGEVVSDGMRQKVGVLVCWEF
jgi:hypothetical protein